MNTAIIMDMMFNTEMIVKDMKGGKEDMTEKRFTYDSKTVSILKDGEFWLDGNIDTACNHKEICDALNELTEDKNDLITALQLAIDKNEELESFKDTTFVLINEMIETANHYRTPIKSLRYGDDLGYWNGVYQKLKELRDILKGDDVELVE